MTEDMSAASVNLLPLAGEKVTATSDKCTLEENWSASFVHLNRLIQTAFHITKRSICEKYMYMILINLKYFTHFI